MNLNGNVWFTPVLRHSHAAVASLQRLTPATGVCSTVGLSPGNVVYVQAGRPKKRFSFGYLFLNINITNVFGAKKRVGHACICPRMVTG